MRSIHAAIFAAGDGARHDGKNIAVGQHDEARAQGGDDLVFQTVGEIGDVVKRHGHGAERVAFLGLRDAFARERGARHSGIEHRMAFLLEP